MSFYSNKSVKKSISVRVISLIGMLSAVAFVLMMLDFPLPIFPAFLKFDISDLPAMIASFALGPFYGVLVQLIKNLLHLFASSTAGVGEFADFIIGSAFVIPAGIIYAMNKTKRNALIGMILGILLRTVVGVLANVYILIPFYMAVFKMELSAIISMSQAIIPSVDSLKDVLIFSIAPFNIVKGAIITLITLFLYKKLTPIIKWARK